MITFQNESRSQADEALQTNQDFMFGAGAIGRVIRRSKSNPFDPLAKTTWIYYDIRLIAVNCLVSARPLTMPTKADH